MKNPADLPPFERAIFDALCFESHQVRKVDVSIGPRSQTVTLKFALTPEQVTQLDEMVTPPCPPGDPAAGLAGFDETA